MNKKFSVDEILLSVDEIIYDKNYSENEKYKIKSNYKRFIKKDIHMKYDKLEKNRMELAGSPGNDNKKVDVLVGQQSFNLETEKIIFDAEESMHSLTKQGSPLVLKNEAILVLEDEFKEEDIIQESNLNEENYIDENNDLKELENNYIYENDLLKSEKLKQQEVIKDLIILLEDFKSKKRYHDLDSKIKLYQNDNTLLRKKIFDLSEQEKNLRTQLSESTLDNQIFKNKSPIFGQGNEDTKEKIMQLNIKIENLSQENVQLQLKLLSSKKEKETDIDQKIKFYREENAKIIIDKSDIQKKLENTKTQLLVNEQNKTKLKSALENLNQILTSSNIETMPFGNKYEEFKNKSSEEK